MREVINLLKKLQKKSPFHKIIIYDYNARHPLFFIESDGSIWQIEGSCEGCQRVCCDAFPAMYPEFSDGKGGCSEYVRETVDGKPKGRCKRHWNKPLGCALYPFNAPHLLPPKRREWDEKTCQYKLKRIDKK